MTRVLDGRYRVLARIGSGGMGAVYRVEHVRLGKIAAMKVLHASSASDREMVKRFWLEAQSVSRLNHPNIVQTFDFGQWTGALYLVMEYVTGDDLAAVVRREGPIEFGRAARFFAQVCSALTEAHEHGIIHRDLKPENLMLTRRRDGAEHAKVLDFGLAKLREREESSAITAGARIVGTPYYMSPEQVRGEALDGRADVYSLGATLYRVLTGFPPFHASTPMGVLTKHVTDEVVPPRARAPDLALPPAADEIVLRAMAKSVDDRYATAAELQRDLAAAVDDVPLAAGVSARTRSQARLARERAAERATVSLPTPGSELDEGSPESPARLRRSDIDDFERALRWRRIATRILLPLVFVGAVAGGTALYLRTGGEKADVVEHEPNNTPGYANLLPMGTTVRGTIGALLANGQGDVDYYRVPAGGGLRVLSARLEGVPGVDLVLELFDGQGKRLAKADAHGRGGGERLQPISIPSTDVFLAVREVWIQGIPPTVSSDRYALTVRWGSPEPGWELEPNDWEAAATRVVAGASVRGYLGDLEDKDWFAVSSPTDGELTVRVTPPAEVDVVLLRSGEKATPVNRRGPGGVEEWTTSISAGTPVLVGVTRKLALNKEPKEPKDLKDPKAQSLTGLDEPYELTTIVH